MRGGCITGEGGAGAGGCGEGRGARGTGGGFRAGCCGHGDAGLVLGRDDGEAGDGLTGGVLDGLGDLGFGHGDDFPNGGGGDAVIDELLGSGRDGGDVEVIVEGLG